MREENSEVELVCPDMGWESEQLNQTKGMNESTYVGIFDEEKMRRIKGHHTVIIHIQ
ncbi:hypothetical protein HanIR_Chr01g0017861 [Helianthus annuus]|nr:hypothetical protein HanIR_Chr01g0017861 [Helianthus annuus]